MRARSRRTERSDVVTVEDEELWLAGDSEALPVSERPSTDSLEELAGVVFPSSAIMSPPLLSLWTTCIWVGSLMSAGIHVALRALTSLLI